jgi:hypothetical protein
LLRRVALGTFDGGLKEPAVDAKRSDWRVDAHELLAVSVPDGPFKALVIRPRGRPVGVVLVLQEVVMLLG